jgi:hypothetical protein
MTLTGEFMPLKVTKMTNFNAIAATIPKWWAFKLLRWKKNLNQSM